MPEKEKSCGEETLASTHDSGQIELPSHGSTRKRFRGVKTNTYELVVRSKLITKIEKLVLRYFGV